MTEYQKKCEAICKAREILATAGLPITAQAVSAGYTEAVAHLDFVKLESSVSVNGERSLVDLDRYWRELVVKDTIGGWVPPTTTFGRAQLDKAADFANAFGTGRMPGAGSVSFKEDGSVR